MNSSRELELANGMTQQQPPMTRDALQTIDILELVGSKQATLYDEPVKTTIKNRLELLFKPIFVVENIRANKKDSTDTNKVNEMIKELDMGTSGISKKKEVQTSVIKIDPFSDIEPIKKKIVLR